MSGRDDTPPWMRVERFYMHRAELLAVDDGGPRNSEVCMAVGFLTGAGMPGCAAAVAVLLEQAEPTIPWPWITHVEDIGEPGA